MRNSIRIAAAIVVAALAIYAWFRFGDPAPRTDGSLTIALDSEVERLSPLTIKNPKTFIVSWQIFEGLVGLSADGSIIPKLASSWQTVDGRVWHFDIREGVRFHDSPLFGEGAKGRGVTADDVIASYTAFCSAKAYPAFLLTDIVQGCADYNAGRANAVSGLRKSGPMQVEVTLTSPEPYFLHRISTPWIAIFPSEALRPSNQDRWGLQLVVGTGPFQLTVNSATAISLVRNPNYWDSARSGTMRAVDFRVIRSDQARLDAVLGGRVDLIQLPVGLFPSILTPDGSLKRELADRLQLASYSTFNSHVIGFNLEKLPDLHLRRAISLGISRREIIATLFFGHARVNGGPVPVGMKSYTSAVAADELYDPEQARKELTQSGYRGEPLELLVHDQASSEQIGQLVQSHLKAIGVNVRLEKVDFNTAIGRMVKGDAPMFSMYFDYVFSSPELVLSNMFASSKRPVPNFWQYSNPAIDIRLAALRTAKPGTSLAQTGQIEKAVVDDAPAAFLFQLDPVLLERKGLPSVPVNQHGYVDLAGMGR